MYTLQWDMMRLRCIILYLFGTNSKRSTHRRCDHPFHTSDRSRYIPTIQRFRELDQINLEFSKQTILEFLFQM